MIPIDLTMFWIISGDRNSPNTKNTTPKEIATTEIRTTNEWISIWRVVCEFPDEAARPAILPNTVSSPVPTTMPFAVPSTARVPKNTRFFVSRGFASVQSTVRPRGSDSPVKEAISTFSLLFSMIRISAGILSPSLTSTTSPTTNDDASTSTKFPSRRASACGGRKFLNFSSVFSEEYSWKNVNSAVKMTTKYRTIPRYKLSVFSGVRPNPINERIAATCKMMAKKLVNWSRSLIYHGVTFGGESWFGPSFSTLSLASSELSPAWTFVPILSQSSSTVT
mmetsp:Transcript_8139/g.12069  ORF Transcript_8139/g.12069 Transcript_8139/m.12069 type:complete len:279 (-) Transcript_8139:215-1051(-)